MSIMAHWITEDWVLEEVMVDFAGLHGAHEGKNLGGTFMSALEEMGLVGKVRSMRYPAINQRDRILSVPHFDGR